MALPLILEEVIAQFGGGMIAAGLNSPRPSDGKLRRVDYPAGRLHTVCARWRRDTRMKPNHLKHLAFDYRSEIIGQSLILHADSFE